MADQSSPIDSTPISPVRAGVLRRNSLEKHLQHRPEAQDLKNRHILLDTAAAPYAPLRRANYAVCRVSELRTLADRAAGQTEHCNPRRWSSSDSVPQTT
jgi:hypothetical protein